MQIRRPPAERAWHGRHARLLAAGLLLAGLTAAAPAEHKPAVPKRQGKMAPLPPAVIDDTLTIAGEDIDGRKVATRMTVAAQINGRGPYRFVVDSGADVSVIGQRAATALQLPLGKPVFLNGMTESSQVDRVLVDQLQLGQSAFHDLELPVLKDRDLGGEGMVGIDALAGQRLMLDFEKRTITVDDARKPLPRMDGEIVVTARRRRGQLILTQVTLNRKPVEAVVDTGSEVTIGNQALRNLLLRRSRDKPTMVAMTGVTGVTVDIEMVRIAELQLGPVLLRDIPIAFAEVPPFAVFGLSEQPALLLGTDLMENFRRVSLDFRARKVRFQLRKCESTGIIISTSPNTPYQSRIGAARDRMEACVR